jgi:PadR family transcriptional regulator PadR
MVATLARVNIDGFGMRNGDDFRRRRADDLGLYLHLTSKCKYATLLSRGSTRLPSEGKSRIQVLQGTLDLIVLRTLRSLGPRHAYGIAARLEQVSGDLLKLNQGTLYPALVRLEQQGWIKGKWDTTENGREAKYYAITKAGVKALGEETQRWRQLSGLVEKLLGEES